MHVRASGADQLLGHLGGENRLAAHGADVADASPGPRLVVREHEQCARGKPVTHGLTEHGEIVGRPRLPGRLQRVRLLLPDRIARHVRPDGRGPYDLILDLGRRDRLAANNADPPASMSGPYLARYGREVPARQTLADGAAHVLLGGRSEEHTSELQSRFDLVCRLLLEKKKTNKHT